MGIIDEAVEETAIKAVDEITGHKPLKVLGPSTKTVVFAVFVVIWIYWRTDSILTILPSVLLLAWFALTGSLGRRCTEYIVEHGMLTRTIDVDQVAPNPDRPSPPPWEGR